MTKAGILGCLVFLFVATGPASAHMTDAELHDSIRNFVRDYPEAILDSLVAYQQAREAAAAAAEAASRAQVIEENRQALFDDPASIVLGNPDGDVTLVEFFDYRCSFCSRSVDVLYELIETDPGLRLVLKEFPILGEGSVLASRASLAAAEQDQGEIFKSFHRDLLLFAGQLDVGRLVALADGAGLDGRRLRRDMEAPLHDRTILANRELAWKLGINGTPAFVMGDRVHPGYLEIHDLRAWISETREAG